MHRKNISTLFCVVWFFFTITLVAQNTCEVNLSITDTVIIVKKIKKWHQYAIKVNTEITVQNLQDTLFLYNFNKYVSPSIFLNNLNSDRYKKKSMGLTFVIEDKNNRIMGTEHDLVSYEKDKDITRILNSRVFVTSKQKIKYRQLDAEEQRNYDLAKYEINSEKQNLELFLLFNHSFGTSNTYHNLPKGEYYLYLVYSFNPKPQFTSKEITDDPKIFKGSIVSNKVKLIVE